MKHAKTLKWLITLACLLTALCAFTFAANAEIVDSGYCGATGCGGNLTWTLDEAGTFTVSGTGDMENYGDLTSLPGSFAPWKTSTKEQQRIKTVIIENGVTGIGSHAFYGCKNLSTVIIPDSVTNIGSYAFQETAWYDNQPDGLVYAGKVAYVYKGDMPANTAIILKDGTKGIAGEAFERRYNLINIMIPDSVTDIGNLAFSYCSGLSSINIPDSVTNIGRGAFGGTEWIKNQPDGLVYAGKVAYQYKGNMPADTTIVLKNGTKGISGAFSYCPELTAIVIPDGVISIGAWAFIGCTGLSSIGIPDSVTNIGSLAFCECKNLVSMRIPASVKSIEKGAFSGCTELRELTVDEDNSVYYSVDHCVVEKATKTMVAGCKSSVIPADGSVTAIGDMVFSGDMGFPSLTIPEGITVLGMQVFAGNRDLETVIIPDSVTDFGLETFFQCWGLKHVVIGKSVKNIGKYAAFSTCENLESVTILDSVESIETQAFSGCRSLKSIIIPTSVTKIGSYSQDDQTVYVDPIPPQTVIYGYAGSYAQQWAKENNHIFYEIVDATPTDATPTDVERKPGDADGDGKLTSADARLALRASVGLKEPGDVEKDSAAYLACDVDGDGKVTSADARLILRASVGLEDAGKFGKRQ